MKMMKSSNNSYKRFKSANCSYSARAFDLSRDWRSMLVTKWGKLDSKLIALVEEILYWHRPMKTTCPSSGKVDFVSKFPEDAWQTSYAFLADKFDLSKQTARRMLVKLEELGIVSREFRTIRINGQDYNNRLFIHLSNDFYKAVTGFKKLNSQESEKDKNDDNNDDDNGGLPTKTKSEASIQNQRVHNIDIYNLSKRNRSMRSNFFTNGLKKNFKKFGNQNKTNYKKQVFTKKPKTLEEFYPLSREDCTELQIRSGREFSLNAMNEILKDAARRLKDKLFYSKKGFMGYMAIFFKHELRDAEKINNENFKIKANLTTEEREQEEQEKYLSEVENSREVSKEMHFKKKLVSVLKPKTACTVLKALDSSGVEPTRASESESDATNIRFVMKLRNYVYLTDLERDLILKQAKATHEELTEEGLRMISSLELVMPSKESVRQVSKQASSAIGCLGNITAGAAGIWHKIRSRWIEENGEEGVALDNAWLCKLDAKIDEQNKSIELKSNSNFVIDWIEGNYLPGLKKLAKGESYSLGLAGS